MSKRLFAFMIFSVLGIAGGVYGADDSIGGSSGAENSEFTLEKIDSLSGQELLDSSKKKQEQAKLVQKRVQNKLDAAYKSEDTVLISGVDDYLSQINAEMNVVEDRMGKLEINVRAGSLKEARQDARIIYAKVENIIILGKKADELVGENDVILEGGTKTEFEKGEDEAELDPDEPDEIDKTQTSFTDVDKVEPNKTGSPYM